MSEIALIGKKIGMTREFYKTGQLVPVTVIKMEKARVIQVIEQEKRGYKAVQLGYGKIKNSKIKKLIITDSIDNSNKIKNNNKIEVLSITPLMSEAIKRIANSNSVSDLFN